MATNPMQRRARNSFLLGMLITTLILGAIIGGLVFMMMNIQKQNKELQAVTVYTINKKVSSGDEVSATDLTPVQVSASVAPANAVSPNSFQSIGEDGETENKKAISKINLEVGTVVTSDMLYIDGSEMGSDVRKQEYNTVVLPMDLETGNFVDIRLLLPNGQDFIVVSKKRVEIPQIGGVDSVDTISMEMSEDEILAMSNAIVEAYMVNGSKLYASKYTDAGNQEAAIPTYPVNGEVANLIENDKNILEKALNELRNRYNRNIRENYINPTISSQETAKENEETKMQESITNSQTKREEYLQSLNGGTVDSNTTSTED